MPWDDMDDYSRHVLRHHPSYGVMLAFQPHRRKLRLRLGLPDDSQERAQMWFAIKAFLILALADALIWLAVTA